jgi:hypothetical protein
VETVRAGTVDPVLVVTGLLKKGTRARLDRATGELVTSTLAGEL